MLSINGQMLSREITSKSDGTTTFDAAYYTTDTQGSTTSERRGTSSSGFTIQSQQQFGAWGETLASATGTYTPTRYGYNGKRYDRVADSYNYGYRNLSVHHRQWTTLDPARDGHNWHAYMGGRADPVNGIDSWGLFGVFGWGQDVYDTDWASGIGESENGSSGYLGGLASAAADGSDAINLANVSNSIYGTLDSLNSLAANAIASAGKAIGGYINSLTGSSSSGGDYQVMNAGLKTYGVNGGFIFAPEYCVTPDPTSWSATHSTFDGQSILNAGKAFLGKTWALGADGSGNSIDCSSCQ